MLGESCRAIHRTSRISDNTDPNLHDYHHNLPAPASGESTHESPVMIKPRNPAVIPQIIGFNPIIMKAADQSPQTRPIWPFHHDDQESKPALIIANNKNNCNQQKIKLPPSHRSSISPRSALQTLLAAARQINHASESNYNYDGSALPLLGANCRQLLIPASPSAAEDGLIRGFNACKESSTVISASKSVQSKEVHHDYMKEKAKTYSEGRAYNNLVRSQGGGLEEQSCHHLYLATSPLTDSSPNIASSLNFLESCSLCKRPLGHGLDIFIYRGDIAFCSAECRCEQITMDERKDRYNANNSRNFHSNKLSRMYYASQYSNHYRGSLVM